MQARVQAIAPQIPNYLIPNMADCDFFGPSSSKNKQVIAQKYQIPSKFVMSYLGTLGFANHLEYLLEIARTCQDQQLTQLHFLIVGKGKQEKTLQKQAKAYQLNNLQFIPHLDKQGIREILELSEATYTSFLDNPVLQSTSPNKFFDSLASGKLSIVNVKGWLKELVEEKQCGFYADPNKPEDFIQKIQPFLANPDLLSNYQANARQAAQRLFDVKQLSQKLVELFLT